MDSSDIALPHRVLRCTCVLLSAMQARRPRTSRVVFGIVSVFFGNHDATGSFTAMDHGELGYSGGSTPVGGSKSRQSVRSAGCLPAAVHRHGTILPVRSPTNFFQRCHREHCKPDVAGFFICGAPTHGGVRITDCIFWHRVSLARWR